MADPLVESLRRLFTDGDLDGARARMLRSSAWTQNQFTAYGDELVSQCWMSWLAVCGLSTCEEMRSVNAPGQGLHLFSLRPGHGREPVRVALWTWHNDEYLKRVFCHIDTAQLCRSLGIEYRELAERLPAPDPLLIEDYDQQAHAGIVDAVPGDLLAADPAARRVLDCWWELWHRMQLANVGRCYAPGAVICIPGTEDPVSPGALTDYCGGWFMRMRRRCCQAESVIADRTDPGSIAVLWRMEGDMDGRSGARRVRVPIVSLLRIVDSQLQSDTMIVDEVTLHRQLDS